MAHRWVRLVTSALAIGALVALVVANRAELPVAGRAIRGADREWLLIGSVFLLGWWAAWVLLHTTSRRATQVLAGRELLRMVPVTLGGIALNMAVKSGGLAGVTLFDSEARARGLVRGRVHAAYLLATAFAELAFLVTLLIGIALTWWDGRLTRTEVVAVVVFLVFLLLRGAALVAAVRSREALRRIWTLPARWWDRLRRRPERTHDLSAPDELYEAVSLLMGRPRAALVPLASAVAIDLIGVAMLWAAIAAVGGGNHPVMAAIAYTISVLFGIVGVLPGGLGFAEVGVVAVLISFGMGTGLAAAAALVFRVWEFWIPLAVGSLLVWWVRRSTVGAPNPETRMGRPRHDRRSS
jgi:uncharacterized protein (TIRG00374 family)